MCTVLYAYPNGTLEMWHKTNSIIFLFHFLICEHSTNTLPSLYWWIRKNWKAKELWGALYFPFLLCLHFQDMCLANIKSRKRYDKIPWLFMFLEFHCPFSAFKQVLIWMESMTSWGCQRPHLLNQRWNTLTSCWAPKPVGQPEFCVHGASRIADIHRTRISLFMLHCPTGFHT